MDIVFSQFSDSGCFLLFDLESGFEPDEEWTYILNHVLDPDGETHITSYYEEGMWPKIWTEAVAELRQTYTNAEFALFVCGEGTFSVRIKDTPLNEQEQAGLVQTFEESLHLPSGFLAVAEGMIFFDSYDDFREAVFVKATLPGGWYKLRIHQMAQHPSVSSTVGFYGSKEWPAIILELVPTDQKQVRIPDESEPFPRLTFQDREASLFQSGLYCYATVTQINGNQVVMRLQQTEAISCGSGRMPLPNEGTIEVGNVIRVRLLQDKRRFWIVEWTGEFFS
ncbi:MAG: hypothetical protein KME19_02380 [Microcoleus vaginatus WJT46-NPBG5]|jgi:hypothetical protein|nr:hypothetical protein [Microcoleus vaginatus WJT46-NPBG5]